MHRIREVGPMSCRAALHAAQPAHGSRSPSDCPPELASCVAPRGSSKTCRDRQRPKPHCHSVLSAIAAAYALRGLTTCSRSTAHARWPSRRPPLPPASPGPRATPRPAGTPTPWPPTLQSGRRLSFGHWPRPQLRRCGPLRRPQGPPQGAPGPPPPPTQMALSSLPHR
jgi:hypothetical protein